MPLAEVTGDQEGGGWGGENAKPGWEPFEGADPGSPELALALSPHRTRTECPSAPQSGRMALCRGVPAALGCSHGARANAARVSLESVRGAHAPCGSL